MKPARISSRPLVFVLLASVVAPLALGAASTAVEKVREGIEHFAQGEFEAAGKAFTDADVAEPENPTITFDRACAAAAAGDVEKATELFQQAALARDSGLAARAHYNLGCLAAEQGRATLGDDPVAAAPEQRQQGLSLLLSAVGHYRDCLRLDAAHADARHNLELIRLFIKYIQAQWEQRDRDKAREEMGLLEFLAMIEQRQTELRSTVRALNSEPDSPQRRQAVSETTAAQTELKDEIGPLKEKITAAFAANQQQQAGNAAPGQGPPDNSHAEQVQQLLIELADEAGKRMTDSASQIESDEFEHAAQRQREALDRLNEIYMAAAPFANVLQRATQQQEQLTATSEAMTGAPKSNRDTEGTNDASPAGEEQDASGSPQHVVTDVDAAERQWEQSRVTDWGRMLSLKAESELPGIEAQLQAAQQHAEPPTDPANPQSTQGDPAAQIEALQKSLKKAIELGPQVVDHSASAAEKLGASNVAGALPDQQEALRLLREIAEPLAQQNQQQDNQQNGENDQQQQNQDQQQSPSEQQDRQPQTGQSPQEQARSVLRRARERERQHRDLQKQVQQMIGGRVRVDRDW